MSAELVEHYTDQYRKMQAHDKIHFKKEDRTYDSLVSYYVESDLKYINIERYRLGFLFYLLVSRQSRNCIRKGWDFYHNLKVEPDIILFTIKLPEWYPKSLPRDTTIYLPKKRDQVYLFYEPYLNQIINGQGYLGPDGSHTFDRLVVKNLGGYKLESLIMQFHPYWTADIFPIACLKNQVYVFEIPVYSQVPSGRGYPFIRFKLGGFELDLDNYNSFGPLGFDMIDRIRDYSEPENPFNGTFEIVKWQQTIMHGPQRCYDRESSSLVEQHYTATFKELELLASKKLY